MRLNQQYGLILVFTLHRHRNIEILDGTGSNVYPNINQLQFPLE